MTMCHYFVELVRDRNDFTSRHAGAGFGETIALGSEVT